MASDIKFNAVDSLDPSETKRYFMDWTHYIAPATVSGSTWAATGITTSNPVIDASGLVTAIFLTGGVVGTDYDVKNTITTSTGETLVGTGTVKVRTR